MKPVLLATHASLNPARYRHARELIDEAALKLHRLDPPGDDADTAGVQTLAHLARAALDLLAEQTTETPRGTQPLTWTEIGQLTGLNPHKAQTLITAHLDPSTNKHTKRNKKNTKTRPAPKLAKLVSSH